MRRALFVLGLIGILAAACGEPSSSPQAVSHAPQAASHAPHVAATPGPPSQDVAQVVAATVPARGSVDVPVTFEGTEKASISVFVPDAHISGTIGGSPLEKSSSGTLHGLGVTLDHPSDGVLQLANDGDQPASVSVMVWIITDRHLVVDAAPFVAAGQPLDVTVSLSAAGPDEAPTVQLVGPDGRASTVAITSAGAGVWTGSIQPPTPGTSKIIARVAGPRPRSAGASVDVGAPDAAISPVLAVSRVDSDGDGLINSLAISLNVTAPTSGGHTLVGTLVDATGARITNGRATGSLTAGVSSPMAMTVDGTQIHKVGLRGPYRLVDMTLFNDAKMGIEAELAASDLTPAYSVAAFEHKLASFDNAAFSVTAVDANKDGVPDAFTVTGPITSDGEGDFEASGFVVAASGIQIASFQSTVHLKAGATNVTLSAEPLPRASGEPAQTGPYTTDLTLMPGRWPSLWSHVESAPALAAGGTVTLVVEASFPANAGMIEIWQRFRPAGAATSGAWGLATSGYADPGTNAVSIAIAPIAGDLELASVAVDGASLAREPMPAAADTVTVVSPGVGDGTSTEASPTAVP